MRSIFDEDSRTYISVIYYGSDNALWGYVCDMFPDERERVLKDFRRRKYKVSPEFKTVGEADFWLGARIVWLSKHKSVRKKLHRLSRKGVPA
jgi:hypothetical protein